MMGRVAVILHERRGNWSGQLRPRLGDRPVRWFETRSGADLEGVLTGLVAPIVLIDLGRQLLDGLSHLALALSCCSDALVLVLDPEGHEGVPELARELGATCVISGFVPPPEVARLVDRWIDLAVRASGRGEWARPLAANSPRSADDWLETVLSESLLSGVSDEPTGRTPTAADLAVSVGTS
jgi:hypothetical protein